MAAGFRRVPVRVSCGSAKRRNLDYRPLFHGKVLQNTYGINDVEVSLVSPLGHQHFFAQEIRFVGRPLLLVGIASLKSGSIVPVRLT